MFDITDKEKTPVPFRWGTIMVITILVLDFHGGFAQDSDGKMAEMESVSVTTRSGKFRQFFCANVINKMLSNKIGTLLRILTFRLLALEISN